MQDKKIPSAVWVLGLASLFTDVSSEMIHAVLPIFLVQNLGSSAVMIGFIEGVGEVIASSLKFVFGALSDRTGKRKPFIVAGYSLSAVVKLLFAIATSPAFVLAARCLDRLGKGIRGAPRDALIADITPVEVRGAAYGLRQSLDSVGAVIGPISATAILASTNDDFRQVFWIALIPAMVPIFLLAFGIKEPSSNREAPGIAGSPAGFRALQARPFTESFKELGSHFWFLFLVCIVFTLGNSSDAFLILKSKEVGVPVRYLPLVLVVMNVIYTACAYPAGKLSDRIGRKSLLMISFALYSIVYAGIAVANSAWEIWLALCFYGVYLGLSQGIILALTADRVPSHLRGTAFGLINLAIGIGLLPASLLAGYLWDNVNRQAPFFVGSAFALLAMLLLSLDRTPKRLAQD